MKIFGILLAAAFSMHFTPIEAHNQQQIVHKMDKKIYINAENLSFSNEGIFWKCNDNWVPISGVECDSHGIYPTGILYNYRATCTKCNTVYVNEIPSECRVCGNSNFDIEYEDIWDR